jgi:glycosyltransferase involved in cell wall biosynthesis
VHIVFGEFLRKTKGELAFKRNSIWFWPRLLHRRVYYGLLGWLERIVYTNPDTTLILMAKKTAADLERLYQRRERCVVMYLGLDHTTYQTSRRATLRRGAREQLALSDDRFVLLLVGNDWHNKGLRVLLDALVQLRDLPIDLLAVGREDPTPFRAMVTERKLGSTVRFCQPRADVEFYYAAADVYTGPSLEDAFGLPAAEAMACGVPAIISRDMGVCEIITNAVDGLILEDPKDSAGLAAMIRQLFANPEFRNRLGRKAAETMRQYTWERNGQELTAILRDILRRKTGYSAQTLTQES